MKKLITTLFSFAILGTCLIAQPINTPTIDKTLEMARQLEEEQKDYTQALEWNEKAYELSHSMYGVFGGVCVDHGPGDADLPEHADEAGDDEVEITG